MSNWILEYSPDIDKEIAKVIPKVLGVAVKNIERIKQGEVNYVYKVETEDKNILVRVARYKGWPNIDKLNWISHQLTETGIPHTKILFSDSSSKYFKFGFIIVDWIDGEDGMSLIKEGKLSRKRAVEKIAETLQKIHKISVEGFGEFNGQGKGKFRSWEERLFSFVEDEKYRKAVRAGIYGENLHEKGIKAMKKIIKELDYKPKSVLTHQDATPENAIFNNDKIVLIDWDNAVGSTWIEDLAWITFWMGKEVRQWFLEVYETQESLCLIEKVEKVIHLRLAITLVPYYLYSTKNYKAVEKMIGKLKNLISV